MRAIYLLEENNLFTRKKNNLLFSQRKSFPLSKESRLFFRFKIDCFPTKNVLPNNQK